MSFFVTDPAQVSDTDGAEVVGVCAEERVQIGIVVAEGQVFHVRDALLSRPSLVQEGLRLA